MIVFRCPCCRILQRAPDEHAGKETFCLKCLTPFRIPTESQDEAALKDNRIARLGARPGEDYLFDPYSEVFGPDGRHTYEYHIFVSYANLKPDSLIANDLAHRCVDAHWRTFFAPQSLHLENIHPDKYCSRWCEKLERALLSSLHLIGVLSPVHLASAYCDLEIQGFLQIAAANPSRGMVLVLSNLDPSKLPSSLLPYVCINEWKAIHQRLSDLVKHSSTRLGQDHYVPTTLFDPLPLSGDEWRFGFGPEEGKRRVYECYVREYMVLILKGVDPRHVTLNWPRGATDAYKSEALEEAEHLLANGIYPYPRSGEDHVRPNMSESIPVNPAQESTIISEDEGQIAAHKGGPRTWPTAGGWCDLVDYAGRGYPQDMDFVCRKCGHREGVDVDPRKVPDKCPKCGSAG